LDGPPAVTPYSAGFREAAVIPSRGDTRPAVEAFSPARS